MIMLATAGMPTAARILAIEGTLEQEGNDSNIRNISNSRTQETVGTPATIGRQP